MCSIMEQTLQHRKKKLVSHFLDKGVLLSADIVKKLQDSDELNKLYTETFSSDALVLQQQTPCVQDPKELERAKVQAERGDTRAYTKLTEGVSSLN